MCERGELKNCRFCWSYIRYEDNRKHDSTFGTKSNNLPGLTLRYNCGMPSGLSGDHVELLVPLPRSRYLLLCFIVKVFSHTYNLTKVDAM